MGKDTKADRKPGKPSSSARAAEALAGRASGAGGFGFGGFVGGIPLGPNVPGFGFGAAAAARTIAATAALSETAGSGANGEATAGTGGVDYSSGDVPLTAQVNGEIAQCIRHLSKKDPTTKTKALQNLRSLIPGCSTADLVTALPPWIYMYRRLILDPSRAVRSETAAALSCLLGAVGKAVAPHLKGLMGPWYLAMHDPTCADAAATSRTAFSTAFSTPRRQLEVVLFCRGELVAYLKDQLAATPQQLGDPRKDSPEEMEERHERVQCACLAALAGLIELLNAPPQGAAAAGAEDAESAAAASTSAGKEALTSAVHDILCRPGFWKASTGAKSASVRRAAYGLARCASQRAADALLSDCAAEASSCVLGALGEKEPGNHGAMWEAVITYAKFCPAGWSHVNLRKMLLPRLYALLRHGCYGSAATSLRALLPLLLVMPPSALGPTPDVLTALLENLWAGAQDPACASRPAKTACMSAYCECLSWGLSNSERLAATVGAPAAPAAASPPACTPSDPDAAAAYCRALLQGSLSRHVLPAALRQSPPGASAGSAAQSDSAAEVVADLVQAVWRAGQKAAAAAASADTAADTIAAAGSSSVVSSDVPLGCLLDVIGESVREALARSVAEAASGAGVAAPAEGSPDLAAVCGAVASLLTRLRAADTDAGTATAGAAGTAATGSCPAGLQAAQAVAAAAAQGLMATAGPEGLPPAASQLLAMLLREFGTGLLAGAAPAAAVGAPGAAKEGGAAGGGGQAAAGASPLPSLRSGGSSFSVEAIIAAYKAGPAEGSAAEASADLLVAFCCGQSAHSPAPDSTAEAAAAGSAAPALWEQIIASVLQSPPAQAATVPAVDTSGAAPAAAAALRRTALLLRRYAASANAAPSAQPSAPAAAAAPPRAWTCGALDAAAVALAEGWGGVAWPELLAGNREAAVELLATALGANAAGSVLLGRKAAEDTVRVLTVHLSSAAAAVGTATRRVGRATVAAAELALAALRGPLGDGGYGLWRLLPEEVCQAVAAVAQLGWQAASLPPAGARRWRAGRSEDLEDEDEDDNEDVRSVSSAALSDSEVSGSDAADDSDEEDAEGEGADDDDDDDEEESSSGGKQARLAAAALADAAAKLWRDATPLTVAAAALPSELFDALLQQLAGLLAAAARPSSPHQQSTSGDAAASSSSSPASSSSSLHLSPRAWAANAAHLVAAVPGDVSRRQGVLATLLSAQPAWRSWSGSAAVETAGPGTSSGGDGPLLDPSLEYLARLVEAAGPRQLLGVGLGVGSSDSRTTSSERDTGAAESEGRCAGRWWVLVELLCSHHHAAGAAAAAAANAGEGEEEEEEEVDSEEDDEEEDEAEGEEEAEAGPGSGQQRPRITSAAHVPGDSWRRAVERAAAATLELVVRGAVREAYAGAGEAETTAEAGARGAEAGGAGGVFDGLLCRVVDELAEGCRGNSGADEAGPASAAAVQDALAPLLPTQIAFLDALCHVYSSVARASPGAAEPSSFSFSPPPLLPHQQRLCRHWLSTTRPAAAASAGLPPRALLRLLPLAAGPVRRAAAAAAAARGGDGAEALLAASGLPELSSAWMRHCLERPPVGVEPSGPSVEALAVAAACFPVPGSGSGCGGATAGAVRLLAGSGGAGLAAAERPLLMQLVRHQLVRHAGMAAASRHRAEAQPAASGSASGSGAAPWPLASQAARGVVTRLAHSAVVYNWRGLGQPDWQALLQDVQDHLAAAVEALGAGLRELAVAARDAADGVLQQPTGTTPAGPMALQLLRKLGQRGVLARMPQGEQLQRRAEAVLADCGLGGEAAEAAAQLAADLVDLSDEVAAYTGGSTATGAAAAARELASAISACCSAVMQLAIGLGGVECYGAAFGPGASAAVSAWLQRHRGFWAAVTRCAGRALVPGHEHLGAQAATGAVAATAPALEEAGLDAVGSLLAVSLTRGSHLLQPVAYRLLLGGALLGRITLAATVGAAPSAGGAADGAGATESAAAAVELPEYDGDDVAYLTAGGVRPEMAQWLVPASAGAGGAAAASGGDGSDPPASLQVYLTAWSLLLAHALDLDPGSRGLAVLRQLLREAGHLVHGLLGRLVPELGLQKTNGPAGRSHHHRHHGHRQYSSQQQQPQSSRRKHGQAAGTAQGAAAATEGWRLAEALREIGLPAGHHAVRATCRSLFRAVLRALPATARTWFGDLRDRGLAAAVESYTEAEEGPALLAAEMASVQGLSRNGGTDDDKFTVRASPTTREVVAVLEVEDGAVLELVVKLPACLPLRPPEVECRRKVGVNDTRLRKWLLSIATFLRHQNGSVADAIALWKRNVDSEFAGVEACLICYSVISSVNAQLPRLVCRTCNVRFHPACLYKWFKSAGKSQCPHCQALW